MIVDLNKSSLETCGNIVRDHFQEQGDKTMIPFKVRKFLLLSLFLAGFSGNAWAVAVPNPNPALFGPDIGGNGLFSHGDRVLGFELFDLAENLRGPNSGFEFGFYFSSDPGTQITIFDASDNNTSSLQEAAIFFNTGEVVDRDQGILQTSFTTSSEDIGFYLSFDSTTLFTQAALNPLGGEDLAGAFPELGFLDSYLIGFGIPNAAGGVDPWAYNLVYPISPSAIPVPGAAGLWLLGIAALSLFRRRLAQKSV